ncbi:thioredoxin domain-containing protein [Mycobacterium avium subsp. hominissuis]|uniref:Thioredoxin domain-containing protein n=3 Tax=Mycobacterium avium TaxID=1764 RepID=A0A2A3LCA7_MYCAV|nr:MULTISPECIES: thioredoxin domain-containing protein [Mycobacterium avium complex (MAC)]ETZ67358.1 N-acylglucosamine 2-epimerase family protein [Mycobacterium sp. MAC_080597_8934]ETZ75635.1 N-acylglucosamine 2-epimerase family protein [Mycobacterium sp. MAC_011194_8550]PBJ38264.1 thioredoxin domain-containing protein [Mycobacterium avium subsp. hominissuis]QCR72185.1 thioredoxin domain-containing protein [Mycobacterium avium subsp. hominissuis]QCR75475.1 thioredoxin domain-containing protein
MSPADPSATNTLERATSPYLRQHADNPVHWQQWTPQALADAAARDVPILLSVGYAACHWCHVMAHESFEDPDVAAAMNSGFVCVKVDREERPDIDAVYMNATVALTGHGGWPMTCFLTPDGRPFFCGTYYPKDAFLQLLSAVSATWRERRGEVEEASDRIAGELRKMTSGLPAGGADLAAALCDEAVAAIIADRDTVHGGFGGAPKFPPSALLEALLRSYERTGSAAVLQAVAHTGAAMARGGIYDQLGGGFARYSVDNAWVVPHFEKMLYDNALLLRVYAHWARRTGDPLAARVTAETARFLLDDLADGDMFTSSLDADADGREGSTYVWTPAQLTEVLGPDDGRWAAAVFGVTETGTFEHGSSVLRLPADPPDTPRFDRVRAALLAARRSRIQPGRDDKVVTSWNGLAITAFTEASVALDDSGLADAARRCARSLLDLHVVDGRLRRASLGGVVGDSAAILEDYAMLATGLLALYQLSAEDSWLTAATDLLDTALAHFADLQRPGRWFDTADDAERLMLRPADPLDGATPSGASSVTEALLTAAHLVGGQRAERYLHAATDALRAQAVLLERAPRTAGHWLAVAEAAVRGPLQIAVACDPARSALLADARRLAPGGAIVVGGPRDSSELLAGRDRVAGADAAYVCRGRVCDLPVTRTPELAAALGAPAP